MELSFVGNSTAYTGTWANYINASANKYHVDPWLIACVIQQESGFKHNNLFSPAGAIGAMQLMPATARGLGVNPYDLASNIDGGTKYLAELLKEFNGNVPMALAGYNWGGGHKAIWNYPNMTGWPAETRNYVTSIMANYSKHNTGATPILTAQNTGQDVQQTVAAADNSLKDKAVTVVKSPVFWLVLLAGLVFKG